MTNHKKLINGFVTCTARSALDKLSYFNSIQYNALFTHFLITLHLKLEIVITRAAPDFRKLFKVMGCVFDINTVHKTVEKLTFQAFY